jgi:glyoxylase-like metal-dependent hydrolase (beta-lactamase superfamily II)
LAGAHAQPEQAAATIDAIREFARREPCVFLPAHDPRSEARLNTLELLGP